MVFRLYDGRFALGCARRNDADSIASGAGLPAGKRRADRARGSVGADSAAESFQLRQRQPADVLLGDGGNDPAGGTDDSRNAACPGAGRTEPAESRCFGSCGVSRGAAGVGPGYGVALRYAGSLFAPHESPGALGGIALLLSRLYELPCGAAVSAGGKAAGIPGRNAGPLPDRTGQAGVQSAASPGCDTQYGDAALAAALLCAVPACLALEIRRAAADSAAPFTVRPEPDSGAGVGAAAVPQR